MSNPEETQREPEQVEAKKEPEEELLSKALANPKAKITVHNNGEQANLVLIKDEATGLCIELSSPFETMEALLNYSLWIKQNFFEDKNKTINKSIM